MGHNIPTSLERGETTLRRLVRASELDSTAWRELGRSVAWRQTETLPGASISVTRELAGEPHFLGWLHQHLVEDGRLKAFEAHTRDERKHQNATATTQLYTPRWVADRLVHEVFAISGPATCLDPACGAGQMLLAWIDILIANGVGVREAFGRVRGVELDPVAAEVCREVLKLHAARLLDERDFKLEAMIESCVVVGDGLFDSIEAADVVVMNPPYMGSRSMPVELKEAIRETYAPFHHDLYMAFIRRAHELADRAIGVLAQQTIWFLSRYRHARSDLLERGHVRFFGHLGPEVFASLSGEKSSVVSFVQTCGDADQARPSRFVDLRDADRETMAQRLAHDIGAERHISDFGRIPGVPIAHWLSPELTAFFGGPRLGDFVEIPGGQNKTGKNRQFVQSFEPTFRAQIHATPLLNERAHDASEVPKWRFYSKGGPYAPWWGNWTWLVDWSDEAREFYATNRTSNLLDASWLSRPGLTYSDFGGRRFAARYKPAEVAFDMTGPAIFVEHDDPSMLQGLLVFLNSTPIRGLLNAMNPSLHYQVRDLRNIPLPHCFDFTRVAEWSELGRELVDTTRALHAFVPGDPMFDKDAPERRAELATRLVELEAQADAEVCELYGVRPEPRPSHHIFKTVGDFPACV